MHVVNGDICFQCKKRIKPDDDVMTFGAGNLRGEVVPLRGHKRCIDRKPINTGLMDDAKTNQETATIIVAITPPDKLEEVLRQIRVQRAKNKDPSSGK
jgi:hypothetical protein